MMRIEHVAIYVKDLEGCRDFYVKYFGAKAGGGYHNVNTDFRSYFLSFDDGARLEIMSHPDVVYADKDLKRSGYIHFALSAGSKARVDEITEQLSADGYTVISGPRTTGDGYYESCVSDPEGNQVEITV